MSSAALASPPLLAENLLGVSHSATGRQWQALTVNPQQVAAISQQHNLPELVARCAVARGQTSATIQDYLQPTLRALLPNPESLQGMGNATAAMVAALQANHKIVVYADYDVDGSTSAALLLRYLRALGVSATLYIPDRLREGYGPNVPAIEQLAASGHQLLVCVDCGTLAFAPLAAAANAGMTTLVLDHHTAEPTLPTAVAVVNPNRLDDTSGLGYLAAVGVTFMFLVALNRVLRAANFFSTNRPEPDLLQLLDLVALGTVCDVVPLVSLNRALVVQGLKVLAQQQNIGLNALRLVARVPALADAGSLGFMLGPRINAGGRVGASDLGTKLLTTMSEAEAQALAVQLDQLNQHRRTLEEEMLQALLASVQPTADAPLLIACGEGWHPGVIGIAAARLVEKYHCPSIVIALDGAIGKASCRSVRGVDIGSMVIAAHQAGLLLAGGGHAMAAGFTVAANKLSALTDFLQARAAKQLAAAPIVPTLLLDGLLSPANANVALANQLQQLAPFGAGNPQPKFAVPEVRVSYAKIVGEKHVSVTLKAGTASLRGIAFRAVGTALGDLLLRVGGPPLHVAGTLQLDEWQGQSRVQLVIEDVAAV